MQTVQEWVRERVAYNDVELHETIGALHRGEVTSAMRVMCQCEHDLFLRWEDSDKRVRTDDPEVAASLCAGGSWYLEACVFSVQDMSNLYYLDLQFERDSRLASINLAQTPRGRGSLWGIKAQTVAELYHLMEV